MSRREPEAYLVARFQDALATDPSVGQLDLEVTVANGEVFLTGQVATEERRAAAEAVVRVVAGDLPVHSSLAVVGLDGSITNADHGEVIR